MIDDLNDTLAKLLPKEGDSLTEAALYSLEGGKRFRPLLTLAVVEAFGMDLKRALIPACAIELIHTYSLIHDDLPCMDDDDMRRGKATLHKAYSESLAVLTGDFLLTFAFESLATAPLLSQEEKNSLITILAKRSGRVGMIGGQVLDIDLQETKVDWEDLKVVHMKKTGALITAALEFGAVLSSEDLAPFQRIGENLGLTFQLTDDLIDRDGCYLLLGEEKTKQLANQYYEKSIGEIRALGKEAPLLEALVESVLTRDNTCLDNSLFP